ncbi:MAG: hypothetical protein WA945_10865 [Arcobacteraceae bacterium]
MSKIKIPVNTLPLFHKYLYDDVKATGNYDLSFEYIGKNFFVVGRCNCKDKGCATVHLECNESLKKYELHPSVFDDIGIDIAIEYLHIDNDDKVVEYEYLAYFNTCCAIYKNEVFKTIATMKQLKQKIRKVRIKKKKS